jgi:hypothetical protein
MKGLKRIHGRLLMITGLIHALFGVSSAAFGKQFLVFSKTFFFNINPGLSGFPIMGGTLDYEVISAFFFFYAGPIWIVYGHALDHMEKSAGVIPGAHALGFLIYTLIGVYMVPFSGMTLFLLPQALYMLYRSGKATSHGVKP